MKLDPATEFFNGLIELQYGQEDLGKMKKLASGVSWAKGWPSDNVSFWNAEAFMWGHKVSAEKRKAITTELKFLENGENLDLGCGAYSYVKSVGFDFSAKMLQGNDNCVKKVVGDSEKELPFGAGSFDSVTLVFVLNYVNNYLGLLREIKRVLNGTLMVVLSQNKVNDWQKQKEVNSFPSSKWVSILESVGFFVNFYEKEGLWFFKCSK